MSKKQQRLTDKLNLALAHASAALSIGKNNDLRMAQSCMEKAGDAVDEAQQILIEIMRAAEKI